MSKKISEVEFTIFDTETTGLDPKAGDRIVEIAGIRLKGEEIKSTFQALINPGREISEAAFAVNKITPQMLEEAPGIDIVLPQFLDFIQGSCLCSYNAGFDLEFLNNELKLIGRPALENTTVVDILKMARKLLPHEERYALWFIADKLGLKSGQLHRALADVEMTREVFRKFQAMLTAKDIFDYEQFTNLFAISSGFSHNLLGQKIASIQEAIDAGVKLKIKYLSGSSAQVSEREVFPKEIRQENGRKYLVGFCCLRQAERTFRIDGILHLQIV
ncbi:MAG: exonuclease domain-containing protein [Candidatus Omnitrophota bacterium]